MKKLLFGFFGILLSCLNLAGCNNQPIVPSVSSEYGNRPTTSPAGSEYGNRPALPTASLENISFSTDYSSVYDALVSVLPRTYPTFMPPDVAMTLPPVASIASPAPSGSSNADYSKTNVQTEGIDEGDIVKTDGTYIYSLHNNKLSIFKADGASTQLISTTEVIKDIANSIVTPAVLDIESDIQEYSAEYVSEMYLCEDFAVIITQFSTCTSKPFDAPRYAYVCKVYIYDVSNPATPKFVYELGQDGSILASRLTGSTLYLLSNHYIYNSYTSVIAADNPETFVPALYDNGRATPVSPSCIVMMPQVSAASYTVVSAMDIPSGTITANQSLLDGGSLVYMSEENLYIVGYEYERIEEGRHSQGVYTTVDYARYATTNISRLDTSHGNVKFAAYGSVPGSLENQFSMDEHHGYLRVVTTDNPLKYSVTAEEHALGIADNNLVRTGSSNYTPSLGYTWHERSSTNGLYVLDMSLSTVGKVDNLAPGEVVYSVRFNGDTGYFVTFRTVDPLFAVDLSDPSEPVVLSALKIPGFSQYLHVYSDGLLFGLGYDANEVTGRRGSMKLSMFDTANPEDVTEAHTLPIDALYSIASNNHKAILVDAKKDIIASRPTPDT